MTRQVYAFRAETEAEAQKWCEAIRAEQARLAGMASERRKIDALLIAAPTQEGTSC